MKYLEELSGGDCFEYNNQYYILSKDFRSNGQKMCIGMSDGFQKWMNQNTIVSSIELFTLDKENNIIALKLREKKDVDPKTKDIF
jgi:hypothetical protein